MPTVEHPKVLKTDLNRRVGERKKKPEDKIEKPKTSPKTSELVYSYRNQSKSKEVG